MANQTQLVRFCPMPTLLMALFLQLYTIQAPPPPANYIYVGKDKYIIMLVDHLILDPSQCGEYGCNGMTYCNDKILKFWTGFDDAALQKQAMLHEIEHMATDCSDQVGTVHQFIYATAPPLQKILSDKRNRALTRWLFSF